MTSTGWRQGKSNRDPDNTLNCPNARSTNQPPNQPVSQYLPPLVAHGMRDKLTSRLQRDLNARRKFSFAALIITKHTENWGNEYRLFKRIIEIRRRLTLALHLVERDMASKTRKNTYSWHSEDVLLAMTRFERSKLRGGLTVLQKHLGFDWTWINFWHLCLVICEIKFRENLLKQPFDHKRVLLVFMLFPLCWTIPL